MIVDVDVGEGEGIFGMGGWRFRLRILGGLFGSPVSVVGVRVLQASAAAAPEDVGLRAFGVAEYVADVFEVDWDASYLPVIQECKDCGALRGGELGVELFVGVGVFEGLAARVRWGVGLHMPGLWGSRRNSDDNVFSSCWIDCAYQIW